MQGTSNRHKAKEGAQTKGTLRTQRGKTGTKTLDPQWSPGAKGCHAHGPQLHAAVGVTPTPCAHAAMHTPSYCRAVQLAAMCSARCVFGGSRHCSMSHRAQDKDLYADMAQALMRRPCEHWCMTWSCSTQRALRKTVPMPAAMRGMCLINIMPMQPCCWCLAWKLLKSHAAGINARILHAAHGTIQTHRLRSSMRIKRDTSVCSCGGSKRTSIWSCVSLGCQASVSTAHRSMARLDLSPASFDCSPTVTDCGHTEVVHTAAADGGRTAAGASAGGGPPSMSCMLGGAWTGADMSVDPHGKWGWGAMLPLQHAKYWNTAQP